MGGLSLAGAGLGAALAALVCSWYLRRLRRSNIEALLRHAERRANRFFRKSPMTVAEYNRALRKLACGVRNEIAHTPSEDEKWHIARRYEAFWLGERPKPERETCWFQTIMLFVPREIRSPALDHVLEDRQSMGANGRPRWLIECVTISQCLGLVAFVAWGFFWDVVNPFKSRSRISGGD
jgi:hypothetical protein